MKAKGSIGHGMALITGASSGMGYEYARQLAERGYDLFLVSNEEEKLEKMALEFEGVFGKKPHILFIDLARTEAAREVYEHCTKQGWEIEILINNAGIYFFGEVVNTDPELVQTKMLLHVVTPSLLCRYFGAGMKKRGHGHILNMSSISAWMPFPGLAFYASTKRYLWHFSRSLRSEMIDYGVNVTCICPGAVATNLFDPNKVDYEKALKTGIMMRADKVVSIALKALFRRKARCIPGFFNKITVPLVRIVPAGLVLLYKRHSKLLPKDTQ